MEDYFGGKILMEADSDLELILSIQVRLTLLKEKDVDIIYTDQGMRTEEKYQRLSKLGVFRKAYYGHAHHFPQFYENIDNKKFTEDENYLDVVEGIIGDETYDCFITSEMSIFTRTVYAYLKKVNHNIFCYFLNEGIAGCVKDGVIKTGIARRLRAKDTRFRELLLDYKGMITCDTEIMEEEYERILVYPKISKEQKQLLRIVNDIYDFHPQDAILPKIIFFEESYVQDGGYANDLEILQQIIDRYGADDILVKLHPRSRKNRFSGMGVHVMENSYVPWEVMLLNGQYGNCLFLSIHSGSVYLPVIWGLHSGNVIMLCNLAEYRNKDITMKTIKNYYVFLQEKIYTRPGFLVPKSMEELFQMIDAGFTQKKGKRL